MKERKQDGESLDIQEAKGIRGSGIIFVPITGFSAQRGSAQQADIGGDGLVDGSDFLIWQRG